MARKRHLYFIAIFTALSMLGLTGCFLFPKDYPKAITKAVEKQDFEKANKLLGEMKNDSRYIDTWYSSSGYEQYLTSYNQMLQAEIAYLINEHDKQSSDRLISRINEFPILAQPSIGVTQSNDVVKANEEYNAEVGKFNSICNTVLARAIDTNNRYLAEAICNTFKPVLYRTTVKEHLLHNDEYYYEYVDVDRQQAREILKQAIEDGRFHEEY